MNLLAIKKTANVLTAYSREREQSRSLAPEKKRAGIKQRSTIISKCLHQKSDEKGTEEHHEKLLHNSVLC